MKPKLSTSPGIEADLENNSLQSVVAILRRIPVPEIQECLSESPLVAPGQNRTWSTVQWLERPLELALHHGLQPMAQAFGADPHELLSYIHPQCRNATASFQRMTLLRPDRVWGGERVYICRTVRPFSMGWNGPDALEWNLVEGSVQTDHSRLHVACGSTTVAVMPSTTVFVAHPSTFIMRPSWITDLVDHAAAAGIPVALPPLFPAQSGTTKTGIPSQAHVTLQLPSCDDVPGYPKI